MNESQIISALNSDLADELGSILQYTDHFRAAQELNCPEEAEVFRQAAIEETRHSERLAGRIAQLNGEPTSNPSPHKEYGDLQRMIEDDLERKKRAIDQYRLHIFRCAKCVDPVTRLMLEQILTDEEKHAHQCKKMLRGSRAGDPETEWLKDRDAILSPVGREAVANPVR